MDYETACEAEVTSAEARAEIRRHCASREEFEGKWAQFVAELGERETYVGGEVLGWLGY